MDTVKTIIILLLLFSLMGCTTDDPGFPPKNTVDNPIQPEMQVEELPVQWVNINGPHMVNEGEIATYTFTIDTAPMTDVEITLSIVHIVTEDVDFVTMPGTYTVTIPAGQTSALFDVSTFLDTVFESVEDFQVHIVNIAGGQENIRIRNDVVITTIADEPTTIAAEPLPPGANAASATETQSPLIFTLSGPSEVDISEGFIEYTVILNKVVDVDVDVTLSSGTTITIEAGHTESSFEIQLSQEYSVGSQISNRIVDVRYQGTFQIADKVVLTMISGTQPIASLFGSEEIKESDTRAEYTVSLDRASEFDSVVYFETRPDTASDKADYVKISSDVTIPAGQLSAMFEIEIREDDIPEKDEYFSVILTGADAADVSTTENQVRTTITDTTPVPEITISDINVHEPPAREEFFPAEFTISLPKAYPVDISFSYSTADGSAVGGSDFTKNSGSVTIPAGQLTTSITIPVHGDQVYEGEETAQLIVSHETFTSDKQYTATVTIIDSSPLPEVSIDHVTADENAGVMTFTVSLSHPSQNDVVLKYDTLDETALADKDYTSTRGSMVIVAGKTESTISVPISFDLLIEDPETFTLNLFDLTGAIFRNDQSFGTIIDASPVPEFMINDAIVEEDAGVMIFTVTLSHPSQSDIVVNYATSDGTAIAGEDYTAISGTLIILAGQTETTISVPIIDDAIMEDTETFTLNLSNPEGALFRNDRGVGTILEDGHWDGVTGATT